MKIDILLFGQLTDIIGADSLQWEDVQDTDQLIAVLNKNYPALAHSKYLVAVDKNIITANTELTDNCTVAFLPPFSGG